MTRTLAPVSALLFGMLVLASTAAAGKTTSNSSDAEWRRGCTGSQTFVIVGGVGQCCTIYGGSGAGSWVDPDECTNPSTSGGDDWIDVFDIAGDSLEGVKAANECSSK